MNWFNASLKLTKPMVTANQDNNGNLRQVLAKSKKVSIDLQVACQVDSIPLKAEIHECLEQAFQTSERNISRQCNVAVRIVTEDESRKLNKQFRDQDKATNVLAFPATGPDGITDLLENGIQVLGDLVICGPLLEQEAEEQAKNPTDHWGHLLVHGMLHLLGYDHDSPSQAIEMETMEKRILADRGIKNPYQVR
jgi:probable rRNA maturation factor